MKVDKTYITSFDSNGKRQDKILFTDTKLSKNLVPMYSRSVGDGSYLLVRMQQALIKVNFTVAELMLK